MKNPPTVSQKITINRPQVRNAFRPLTVKRDDPGHWQMRVMTITSA
ncbi:hypothetical protein KZ774_11245 [Escherichia coli]|nr:hypothetical protein [Escherichia coli]